MKQKEIKELKKNESKNWRMYDEKESVLFNSYCRDSNMVLSNMYPCVMWYNGLIFNSVDHLYNWLMFDGGDEEARKIRDKIYKCSGVCNGFESKRIRKDNDSLIPEKNKKNHLKILKTCHIVKAKCCREFREKLIESGDKNLVEFAWWGDCRYGVVKDKESGMYEGMNMCGRVMMEVRRMLLAGELGEFDD